MSGSKDQTTQTNQIENKYEKNQKSRNRLAAIVIMRQVCVCPKILGNLKVQVPLEWKNVQILPFGVKKHFWVFDNKIVLIQSRSLMLKKIR